MSATDSSSDGEAPSRLARSRHADSGLTSAEPPPSEPRQQATIAGLTAAVGGLLRIYLAADMVRLEIQNAGTAGTVAAKQPDRQNGGGGFGLELVDLLATRWGVYRRGGTTVWLEMGRA